MIFADIVISDGFLRVVTILAGSILAVILVDKLRVWLNLKRDRKVARLNRLLDDWKCAVRARRGWEMSHSVWLDPNRKYYLEDTEYISLWEDEVQKESLYLTARGKKSKPQSLPEYMSLSSSKKD